MSFVGLKSKKDVVCGSAYYAEESLLIKTFIIYAFFYAYP